MQVFRSFYSNIFLRKEAFSYKISKAVFEKGMWCLKFRGYYKYGGDAK